jgi:hypothetical protein
MESTLRLISADHVDHLLLSRTFGEDCVTTFHFIPGQPEVISWYRYRPVVEGWVVQVDGVLIQRHNDLGGKAWGEQMSYDV